MIGAVARKLFGAPPAGLKIPRLVPLPTAEAQEQFLGRFRRLAIGEMLTPRKC